MPMATETPITTVVNLIVSALVGQMTLASSVRACFKKVMGLVTAIIPLYNNEASRLQLATIVTQLVCGLQGSEN